MSERGRAIRLLTGSLRDRPALDTALSHALLERIATGSIGETLRLFRPGPVVAFGPQDTRAKGLAEAVSAARSRGFDAVARLAGGRAVLFHEQTVAFAWAMPDSNPRGNVEARFREVAGVIVAALRGLGVDARVGEVPGEYCSGRYSVNARGVRKLVGVGQRLRPGATHVGGVVVVADEWRVRDVLLPVYAALGRDWDPSTAGSVAGEVGGVEWEDVRGAIVRELEARYRLAEAEPDRETLALAERLEPRHRLP